MAGKLNLLAVDLGASNGRVILGSYDGSRLETEVIHKFSNTCQRVNGQLFWNILGLFAEVKSGLRKAVQRTGSRLNGLGVDTWGVDYGLLDRAGNLLSFPYHYRDDRTCGLLEEVINKVGRERLYEETGSQFLQFNTIYQLYADRKYRPWIMDSAHTLLFMPDLINYFLTGFKYNEYTIASTSQLFNPVEDSWLYCLLEELRIPGRIMQKIIYPGCKIGSVLPEIRGECGLADELTVFAVGSHDTASAVVATPLVDCQNSIYISSGTWSLLGMELDKAVINSSSLQKNFTNELGVEKKVRFLKNLTGLWLIQECKRSWEREGQKLTYDEISRAAGEAEPFKFRLAPDDPVFLNPSNMPEAVREYCRKTGQPEPTGVGEMARGIYESLALSYNSAVKQLEELVDREIVNIHMVGGGIQAEILCQFTADITGRRVITGPIEATAMGNIISQLMGLGELQGLEEGREVVRNSVELREYYPH